MHSEDAELVGDSAPAELQLAGSILRFAAATKVERKHFKDKPVCLRAGAIHRLGHWLKCLRFWH